MGQPKGFVPSAETRAKVSEALKKAYAEGRRKPRSYEQSAETKRLQSESLKRAYAEGRMKLTGNALAQSLRTPEQREASRQKKVAYTREWRLRNRERMAQHHRVYVCKKYGISPDEFMAKLAEQDGKCAVCKCEPNGRHFAQDHDHVSGENRGLLCSNCNLWLGKVNDSIEILQAAIKYLTKYRKQT